MLARFCDSCNDVKLIRLCCWNHASCIFKKTDDYSAAFNLDKMIISSKGRNIRNMKYLSMRHGLKFQECHEFDTLCAIVQHSVTKGKYFMVYNTINATQTSFFFDLENGQTVELLHIRVACMPLY